MAATLMVHLYLHLKGQKDYSSAATSFIEPNDRIWGLKDSIAKVFVTNLFNIETHQLLPIENLDVEGMLFRVAWDSSTGSFVPKSEVLDSDVKELMEILKNRGWKDVLEVSVVFDPAIKSGLKTMTEGDRAWAPIIAKVDEEERLRKSKVTVMKIAGDNSDMMFSLQLVCDEGLGGTAKLRTSGVHLQGDSRGSGTDLWSFIAITKWGLFKALSYPHRALD
ncbi:hypothetical protein BKA65DRAFT_474907 [Rhexocercosporidium sp. MPI-PUGE-AT-0058]|nr:hypothetical protein BKA65DRAFT_474907 [Rhexocercosporidium sp. MPI-PUGE-AT-0058]